MDDEIAREARRRDASHHEGHRKFRPHLRPNRDSNLVGLRGEAAFAERFGLEVDLTPRLGGDGHKDLTIALKVDDEVRHYNVDCKAAVKPKDLIVETDVCSPLTIYVLCRYHQNEDRCTLIGWQWGAVLMRSTPRDYGYGVINYWCPAQDCRSIDELEERMA